MTEPTLRITDVSAPDQQSGCGCGCSDAAEPVPTEAAGGTADPAVTTIFQVTGMTCGHCVASVTRAVTAGVPGVTKVEVDLASGQVTVASYQPVSPDLVKDAVNEAGYELVPGSLH